MKNFTKALLAVLFAGAMAGNIAAKDVYVSTEGNDENSGLAADEAKLTLTGINDILEQGDIIHVSGMLDMTNEIALSNGATNKDASYGCYFDAGNHNGFAINSSNNAQNSQWKEVTLIGENPKTDGFDANHQCRIFHIRGNNTVQTVTFKNLGFINGLAPGDGAGGIFIENNAWVDIDNCYFYNNHLPYNLRMQESDMTLRDPKSERGGAIYLQTGKLNLTNSELDHNFNRRGGGLHVQGGTLYVYNTSFHDNGGCNLLYEDYEGYTVENTRGGGVCLWAMNSAIYANFDHCSFRDNGVWNQAGGVYLYNSVGYGHMIDAVFTNCDFIGNYSVNAQAGAVQINNAENAPDGNGNHAKNIRASFANCTFMENVAKNDGGAIHLYGGLENDVLRLVNCTLVNNMSQGGSGGHGAGYCETKTNDTFTPANVKRYFYNCLMEYNGIPLASSGKGEYSDFATRFGGQYIENCHIGRFVAQDISLDDMLASLNDGTGAPETLTYNTSAGNWETGNNTFKTEDDNRSVFDDSEGYLPVVALNEENELLTAGNSKFLILAPEDFTCADGTTVKHLQGFDIFETDQLGFPRTLNRLMTRSEGDAEVIPCAIGALEASYELLYGDGAEDSYFNGKTLPYLSDDEDIDTGVEKVDAVIPAIKGVYNLQGVCISRSDSDIRRLPAGIYIVDGKKVIKR